VFSRPAKGSAALGYGREHGMTTSRASRPGMNWSEVLFILERGGSSRTGPGPFKGSGQFTAQQCRAPGAQICIKTLSIGPGENSICKQVCSAPRAMLVAADTERGARALSRDVEAFGP